MEIDRNLNDILDILREVTMFLECLQNDAQLPLTLETLQKELLARLKNILSVATMTRERALSPEPYLDMKSGPKSLLLTRSEVDSEEYVGMEESQKHIQRTHSRTLTHQDYYETFESENQVASAPIVDEHAEENDKGQVLTGIYKNLSAMQIKSKCYKCGPLYRKEGKKLFLSESRACWIALIGSHLLIYRSERHNRPYAIYPIRGYMARPAPNMIFRDRRKSESAFEMYRPGNETLQFIARTPKDMDQWIAKICEVGCNRNENEGSKAEDREEKKRAIVETSLTDCHRGEVTQHRDAEKSVIYKSTAKAESASNNKNEIGRKDIGRRTPPPALPARIPRRLPSLPPTNSLAISSCRSIVGGNDNDDDDDDDIYHRIEDLRHDRYQNMVLSKKQQADVSAERRKEALNDDVCVSNERNEKNEKMEEQIEEEDKSCDAISFQETYDDIVTLSQIETERHRDNDISVIDGEEREEEVYDDVENLIPNRRFIKDHIKDRIEMSNKLKKKTFLNRVLSRREFSGKSVDIREKREERHHYKGKVSSNPSLNTEEISTYDDVSLFDLTNEEILADRGEELAEYNCPPPPRPIYDVRSPVESYNPDQTQEFYDDISACREKECNKNYNHQQIILQSPQLDICAKVNEIVHSTMYNITKLETNDGNSMREEMEHYQLPRSDSCICDSAEQNEQLYDDIALWADFTARQRDIVGKRENEDDKSISSDKKTWNRFAVNRKSRVTSDFNCSAETNKRGDNEIEDSPENGMIKRNTFQKLISRMENSLAKVSARSPSSLSTGKSSVSNNNS